MQPQYAKGEVLVSKVDDTLSFEILGVGKNHYFVNAFDPNDSDREMLLTYREVHNFWGPKPVTWEEGKHYRYKVESVEAPVLVTAVDPDGNALIIVQTSPPIVAGRAAIDREDYKEISFHAF